MQMGYPIQYDDGSVLYVDDVTGAVIGSLDNTGQYQAYGITPTYGAISSSPMPASIPASATETDWLKMISEAAPKVLQLWNAQQIAQVNIERAQRGLAPLNPAGYGPQVALTMPAGTQQMLLYGAIGLGAFMLLNKKGRR